MSKQELVESIAEKSGLTKADSERALKAYQDSVEETLAKGESVSIVGFGTFSTSKRAERTGRNPKTGENITIAARTAVTFKAGSKLKAAVNK